MIEPRGEDVLLVTLQPMGGHRHDRDMSAARFFQRADLPGGLLSVDLGHGDVHEDDVGLEFPKEFHGLGPVFGEMQLDIEILDHFFEDEPVGPVVVRRENPHGARAARLWRDDGLVFRRFRPLRHGREGIVGLLHRGTGPCDPCGGGRRARGEKRLERLQRRKQARPLQRPVQHRLNMDAGGVAFDLPGGFGKHDHRRLDPGAAHGFGQFHPVHRGHVVRGENQIHIARQTGQRFRPAGGAQRAQPECAKLAFENSAIDVVGFHDHHPAQAGRNPSRPRLKLVGRGQGQRKAEDAAPVRLRFDPDLAAHQLDQPPGYGKAEAGALELAVALALDLIEFAEDVLDLVGRDADAGILDEDAQIHPLAVFGGHAWDADDDMA